MYIFHFVICNLFTSRRVTVICDFVSTNPPICDNKSRLDLFFERTVLKALFFVLNEIRLTLTVCVCTSSIKLVDDMV